MLIALVVLVLVLVFWAWMIHRWIHGPSKRKLRARRTTALHQASIHTDMERIRDNRTRDRVLRDAHPEMDSVTRRNQIRMDRHREMEESMRHAA